MGKKNKKNKGSFWKEAPNKAVAPDPEVEEEFPALGLTHAPAPVSANCPPDFSALVSMETNDLMIQKQTDPAGKSE